MKKKTNSMAIKPTKSKENEVNTLTASENSGPVFRRADGLSSGSDIEYINPAKLAEAGITGVILQATFAGATPNAKYPEKLNYNFVRDNGSKLVLNSAGNLAFQMSTVSEGQLVRITYQGMLPIKKGPRAGKNSHSFIVEVA